MNNTSCNQLKVVQEPEIQGPSDKEWQHENVLFMGPRMEGILKIVGGS